MAHRYLNLVYHVPNDSQQKTMDCNTWNKTNKLQKRRREYEYNFAYNGP